MSNRFKTVFLALGLLTCGNISAIELNEANIQNFLAEVDTAIANLDIDAYENLISDDAKFIVTFVFQGRQQQLPYSKQRYLKEMRKALPLMQDYQYNRSNTEIKIIDAQAIIKADITESVVVNRRARTAESESQVIVKVINDQLKITELTGDLGVFSTGR